LIYNCLTSRAHPAPGITGDIVEDTKQQMRDAAPQATVPDERAAFNEWLESEPGHKGIWNAWKARALLANPSTSKADTGEAIRNAALELDKFDRESMSLRSDGTVEFIGSYSVIFKSAEEYRARYPNKIQPYTMLPGEWKELKSATPSTIKAYVQGGEAKQYGDVTGTYADMTGRYPMPKANDPAQVLLARWLPFGTASDASDPLKLARHLISDTEAFLNFKPCTHPSWRPIGDGKGQNAGRYECEICGAQGNELRYLAVDGRHHNDRSS
jgi:hypothetical protein